MFSATASRSAAGTAPSIVSSDVAITGALQSRGDIRVDGRVDGNVRCACLMVGENGVINGQIHAGEVTVRGRGGWQHPRPHPDAVGDRAGGSRHPAPELEVESGAFVRGSFRHSSDPLADSPPEAPAEAARRKRRNAARANSPMRAAEGREAAKAPEDLRAAG